MKITFVKYLSSYILQSKSSVNVTFLFTLERIGSLWDYKFVDARCSNLFKNRDWKELKGAFLASGKCSVINQLQWLVA